MHKPNAKSASEIGRVNEPLDGTLYSQKRIFIYITISKIKMAL